MPAKSRAAIAKTVPAAPVRNAKPKAVHARMPIMSEHELDEKLEQIRIRGAQISADLKAMAARFGTN